MKHMQKFTAAALAVLLLGSTVVPAFAETAPSAKEEVIYAMADASGKVTDAEAVNIFAGGDIVDYGDYSTVHPLNTEDAIEYKDGEVTFHSDAQRVYYQGNLNSRDLPWLFAMTYTLDGRDIDADELAGKDGHVEIRLSVRKNPNYTGNLFSSHALQITAALDTAKCTNIVADGATEANVGTTRQMSYIVLPNTEEKLSCAAFFRSPVCGSKGDTP